MARHTVTTLAISTGTDISTVGKILGHKSRGNTQVCAKVSLESKMEVVNLTDGVLVNIKEMQSLEEKGGDILKHQVKKQLK
ncbi:MAG: hypothetical protein IJV08_07030 [Bacteroidaceae bacterium]|nr:hypothetical protein [Bacteroidaceae bacterium]